MIPAVILKISCSYNQGYGIRYVPLGLDFQIAEKRS